MTDQKAEDWLPTGWAVEVKLRNNGRRDKFYYDTSSGQRFNSKVEVLRYLQTSQVSQEDKPKIKETLKRPANDVVVEKTIAEGLPPGWIKEIRTTKKAQKIRKDSYYIDPVSERIFRSMKDVHRYLENEEPLKSNGRSEKELEDEKADSLNMNEIMKDKQMLNLACNGESPTVPAQTSDQDAAGEVGSESGCLNPPEANGSDQKEQDDNCTNSESISVPSGGGLPDESKKAPLGLGKSKNKKGLNLPRRASKRLAKLEVEVPVVKPSTRSRQVAIKQPGEGLSSATEGSSSGNSTAYVFQQLDEPEKHNHNVEPVINGDEKKRFASLSQSGSQSTLEERGGKPETGDMVEENPGSQPDLTFGDFLTDPCIAFAIETLTGVAFDNSRTDSEHSSGDMATNDRSKNVETDDKSSKKLESNVDLPFGGSWPDPCIEFAIKTLTGAIPVDYDPHIEEYFQQQLSSSKTHRNSDLTLKNVGIDNFCKTDVLCQQYSGVSEQAVTRNAILHSSGGSSRIQNGRDRQSS